MTQVKELDRVLGVSGDGAARQEIVPEREPENSFIGFIDQHQEALGQLSFLTSDLREEEEGWRQSVTFDQLAQGLSEIIDAVDVSSGRVNASGARDKKRYFGHLKRDMAKRVFEEREGLRLSDFIVNIPRYKAQKREEAKKTEEAMEALNSFSRDYHKAIGNIRTPLREIRRELSEEFRTYLQQDCTHLSDFAAFLSEKEHTASRDAIRPFLVGIAQEEQQAIKDGKKGTIQEVSEQWSEWVSSGLRDEVFLPWTKNLWAAFSAKNEGRHVNPDPDESFVEFARFLVSVVKTFMPEENMGALTLEDTQQVLGRIRDINMWPRDLKNAYLNFGKARIGSAVKEIRQSLLKYRQRESLPQQGMIFDSGIPQGGKRKHQMPVKKASPSVTEETPVKEASKPYDLGILVRVGSRNQVKVMTEEEAERYILRQARRIAKKEQTLVEDVRRLVDTARKDQYANTIGIKTITWQRMMVSHRGFAFRSFDPRARIGLELINKSLYDYRLVYAVDVANRVVIVDGLYDHNKYLRRFNMSE